MGEPAPCSDCQCERLRNRIAFNILLDECVIASLSDTVAVLREAGDPDVSPFEHAIRTHRIGILKQQAILGAAGIDV